RKRDTEAPAIGAPSRSRRTKPSTTLNDSALGAQRPALQNPAAHEGPMPPQAPQSASSVQKSASQPSLGSRLQSIRVGSQRVTTQRGAGSPVSWMQAASTTPSVARQKSSAPSSIASSQSSSTPLQRSCTPGL